MQSHPFNKQAYTICYCDWLLHGFKNQKFLFLFEWSIGNKIWAVTNKKVQAVTNNYWGLKNKRVSDSSHIGSIKDVELGDKIHVPQHS